MKRRDDAWLIKWSDALAVSGPATICQFHSAESTLGVLIRPGA